MLLSHGEALEGRPGQPEARGAGRFPGRRAQGVVSLWKGPLGEGFPETSTIIHSQHLVSVSGEVRQADRRGWKQATRGLAPKGGPILGLCELSFCLRVALESTSRAQRRPSLPLRGAASLLCTISRPCLVPQHAPPSAAHVVAVAPFTALTRGSVNLGLRPILI